MSERLSPIVITPGDLTGIGPEITAKACSEPGLIDARGAVLLGDEAAITEAFERWGDPSMLNKLSDIGQPPGEGACGYFDPHAELPRRPHDVAPEATALRHAVEGCQGGTFAALVTGPIAKDRLLSRGFPYPGHTGYLAHLTQSPRPVMSFLAQNLKVALYSDHIPLNQVSQALDLEALLQVVSIADEYLKARWNIPRPRIGLCGLNPHAGEGGKLGKEEGAILEPAVKQAQARGYDLQGPFPADTIFQRGLEGKLDLIIALYHDQGLIPIKLLGRGAAVHVTMGLPIIRTSVDHGTAHDIAGKGLADPSGLRAAILEAQRLCA